MSTKINRLPIKIHHIKHFSPQLCSIIYNPAPSCSMGFFSYIDYATIYSETTQKDTI